MKRILLFAAMTLIAGAWSLSANAQQQDVTATYLTNADFSSGTPIDNSICTYGKDMAGNGTTYYGAQAIDGWTSASVGTAADGYNDCGLAAGLFAYGGTPWVGGTGFTAPATDPNGNAGNAAGLIAVWSNTVRYTQDVTLEAGSYTVKFKVYNQTNSSYNSGKIIGTNLFGFAENGGTTHYAPNNTFAIGQWTTVAVTFELSAQTAGKISMGYVSANAGAANMPHLFVDHVQILKNDYYTDASNKVNATGWTRPYNNDGNQGSAFNRSDGVSVQMQATYGNSTANRQIYQTLTGLDNGTYEAVVYAYSQQEWGNGGASLTHDAGDVGVVFAEGGVTVEEWINARRGPGYPSDGPGKYTLSGIKVTDGTLTLGYEIKKANQTEWHAIQLQSLIYTNGVDLSDYAEALQLAVDAANALQGKIPAAAYTEIDNVVTANNQVYTTPEDYTAATAAINTAIATYGSANMQAAYAAYNAAEARAEAFTEVAVTPDTQEAQIVNEDVLNSVIAQARTAVENVTTDVSAVTAQIAVVNQAALDYITGLEPVDTSNDFDVTYLIVNPNFDADANGWTSTTGAQNRGITTNMSGFPNPPTWENWNGSAYTGKMYQTLTGLPAGKYEFSIYAGVNTLGNGTNQYVYANDSKAGITATDPTKYTVTDIQVLDGTLEFGFEQTSAVANWCCIDQATLKYVGPFADLTPYIDAWMAALEAARETAATNQKIANWVLTELNNTISANDEDHVDQTSQAALEDATAALLAANELGQKSIHSYAVVASGHVPDNSLEGWTCETFVTGQDVRFQVNTWSTEGNSDGSEMRTPFIENWTPGGNHLGEGKVYYRLEGLEPGEVYRVSALVRSYNEASNDAPNGPNFYVNDDVADLTEVGTTFSYNGMSGIYGTQLAAATIGQDGILELGIVVDATINYNWVAFKNIQISTYDAALEAAIARVEALEGKVPTGPYADAYAVVTANTGANYPTTAEQFEAAIDALNQAADDLEPMVEEYGKFLELKAIAVYNASADCDDTDAQHDFADLITDAQAAADAATTIAEVGAANTQLRYDMDAFVDTTNPVNDGQYNLTYKLTNPDVTNLWTGEWYVKPEGWYNEQNGGNFQVMQNDRLGPDGEVFMEYWSENPAQSGFVLCQKVTLPAGTYKMAGRVAANFDNQGGTVQNVFFAANDALGTQITSETLMDAETEFVQSSETPVEVRIGMVATSGNQARWMAINKIQLFKVPAQTYTVGADAWDPTTEGAGDVTVARKINAAWNAICFPFGMTQAEVEQYFGEGSVVKLVNTFDLENEHLNFTTREGIQANQPCLLKATTEYANGLTIEGRTIVAVADGQLTDNGETVYEGTEVSMFGCYAEETDVPDYALFVQGGKLVFSDPENEAGNGYIYSTRAYIVLNGWNGPNGIKGLNITGLDDDATGIAVVENGELRILDGQAYDLSGRAVKNPAKGLYIINGKKVFIK